MDESIIAVARQVECVWHIDVPSIRRSTQAPRRDQIASYAADLVASMRDEEVDPARIVVVAAATDAPDC